MVLLIVVGLLIVMILVMLPEVSAKLRVLWVNFLLTLFIAQQFFTWKFLRGGKHNSSRAADQDTAVKFLLILFLLFIAPQKPQKKAETWLVALSFWLPRKHREAVTGDIFEDCAEMRGLGYSERRIRIQVLWQFAIAVLALWPEAVGSAVATIVKQVWSIRK